MSSRREPSTPPAIPGYEPAQLLGMGGFADVFLYTQRMPRRSVAVKVLLASHLSDEVRGRFRTEADLMAQLSHHPSIVTIYHADVAPDGRPYLVMEYCSRAGLGQRYRTERMGVAEVLRLGIRLASAVETAHRAGILHRDIKPANVLITDFGWPALTDFGIAATTFASGAATGMSIPWSPPEMLAEDPVGDVRSDVYSLAATVYSLLARRSPFEVPDGSNGAADLIMRIERSPLAPTGRGDVPDSLHAVLARAMDRSPDRRHHSALAFARALQQVEAELMLPLTPLDLPEDLAVEVPAGVEQSPGTGTGTGTGDEEEDQATRLRPVASVSPDAPVPTPVPVPVLASRGAAATLVDPPESRLGATADEEIIEAWRRSAEGIASAGAPATERRSGPVRTLVAVLSGVIVVGAVAVAGVLALGGPQRTAPVEEPTPTAVSAPPVLAVPSPEDVQGRATGDGDVVFTWTNPDPQDGDQYLWGLVTAGSDTAMTVVEEPTVTVTPTTPGEVCVEVAIVREDRRASTQTTVGCATDG